MIHIADFHGEDFKVAIESGEWKIGLLRASDRFSNFRVLERHTATDEAFILLKGRAVLYLRDDAGEIHTYRMKPCTVYTVEKNVWHHIKVSKHATVLVVENRNTSKENTERIDR